MLKEIKTELNDNLNVPTYNEIYPKMKKAQKLEKQLYLNDINTFTNTNSSNNKTVKFMDQKENNITNNNSNKNLMKTSTKNINKAKTFRTQSSKQTKFKSLKPIKSLTNLENSTSLNLITTSKSHKGYDIKFKPTSSKSVITTSLENHVDINTFEKEAHLIQKKLVIKSDLEKNIELLQSYIHNTNQEIEKIKLNTEYLTEENRRLIFEREREEQKSINTLREIPILKEDIKNLRNHLKNTLKEKEYFEYEAIKCKEEIIELKNKIKELEPLVNRLIKEVEKLKYNLRNIKEKNQLMKKEINLKDSSFVKDIAKLIPPKEKKMEFILNALK
jgi:hypothetical protein